MDPVSLAASIVAFIEITDRVIKACKYCIDTVKDAPRDMQIIMGEATSLRAIMDSLGAADLHDNTIKLVPSLLDKTGPVEACRRCLVGLEALLPPEPLKSPPTGRRRITLAELAWPFKESKARKLLAEMSLHKSTLLLAITGDMVHNLKDIRSGVHRLEREMNSAQRQVTEAQRQEVYRWLERTNPSSLHNLAVKNHEPETGTWLLRLPEWQNWLHQSDASRLLWLHGIPGAGKTVLASFLIEELKKQCSYSEEIGRAYYYCHYTHNQDEAAPFLRWLVSQVCRQAQWVPDQLLELHNGGCDPSIPELENVLELALSKFRSFHIVIDAVDESSPREDLLAVIATLAVDIRFQKLKVLATSRPYFDIERMLKGVSVSISMSNPSVELDIRRMVHSRLHSSRRLKRFSHLFDRVEEALVTGAQGMFRWAHCQIYNIEQLRDESQLLSAIRNLPKDLAETYVRGLSDVPENDRSFVRRVFTWICGHAQATWLTRRGINANVLLTAVAYDLGLQAGTYNIDDLRELCGCLIDVEVGSGSESYARWLEEPRPYTTARVRSPSNLGHDSIPHADTDLFVSFGHYTVKEFLESSHILPTGVADFSLPLTTTKFDFTESLLVQALLSDPNSLTTDWIADRESYCLTVACSIYCDAFTARPDIQDLFLQYFNFKNPHYRRIPQIQQRIIDSWDPIAQTYLLRCMHMHVRLLPTMDDAPEYLATVLNIRLVRGKHYNKDDQTLVERCLAVYGVKSEEEVSQTVLSVTVVRPKEGLEHVYGGDSHPVSEEITFQGTFDDILQQVGSFEQRFLRAPSQPLA